MAHGGENKDFSQITVDEYQFWYLLAVTPWESNLSKTQFPLLWKDIHHLTNATDVYTHSIWHLQYSFAPLCLLTLLPTSALGSSLWFLVPGSEAPPALYGDSSCPAVIRADGKAQAVIRRQYSPMMWPLKPAIFNQCAGRIFKTCKTWLFSWGHWTPFP